MTCGSAHAEDSTQLFTRGSWTLYRINGMAIAYFEHHILFNQVCVARSGNDQIRFDFMTFPADVNRDSTELSGIVFGQITSPSWHFGLREDELVLSTANFNLSIFGTEYADDMIMFNMGGNGSTPAELEAFATTATGTISVSDQRGREIARFPTNGLAEVYARMLECGGLD